MEKKGNLLHVHVIKYKEGNDDTYYYIDHKAHAEKLKVSCIFSGYRKPE
jgi:hypothetical protein